MVNYTAVRTHITCLLCDVASCWHSGISMEEQRCLTYVRLLHITTLLFIWCDRDLLCPQQLKLSWANFLRELYFCASEKHVVRSDFNTQRCAHLVAFIVISAVIKVSSRTLELQCSGENLIFEVFLLIGSPEGPC